MCVSIPRVPRPPNLINPNRLNGTEKVTMLGVTCLIAITLEGCPLNSFAVVCSVTFDIDMFCVCWFMVCCFFGDLMCLELS